MQRHRLRAVLRDVSDQLDLWWQGTPYENDRGSSIVFLNHYQRHWTSRVSRAAWDYFKAHHQWIIGLAVAITLAVAVKMR
jgi:hypothetical protein